MFTTVPMLHLRRDVDRLFDESFTGALSQAAGLESGRPTWAPAADVRESDAEYVLELEVPGVDPATLELTVERGVLTVSGERANANREGERVHLRERMRGRFVRSFRLPKGFDENAIVAETEHGLLRVRLPKAALPQPRRITVQAAGSSNGTSGHVSNGTAPELNASAQS
jgi:HSP20 family protein